MKNWALILILVLGSLFLAGPGNFALAEEKEKPKTKIEGYGDYLFGTPLSSLNLKNFTGPGQDISYGITNVSFYEKEGEQVTMASGLGATATLSLFILGGKLEGVHVTFTDLIQFKDLDLVGNYVRELRAEVVKRYDPGLVQTDWFVYVFSSSDSYKYAWNGLLQLKDETGNKLSLVWDSYSLALYYKSIRLEELIERAQKKSQEKSKSKF